MSKFIKPATLTVPKEVEEFLSEIYEYCDGNGNDFYNIISNVLNGEERVDDIEITYEDWAQA